MPTPSHVIPSLSLMTLATLGCMQAAQAQEQAQATESAAATLSIVTVREKAALRPLDVPPARAGGQVATGSRLVK